MYYYITYLTSIVLIATLYAVSVAIAQNDEDKAMSMQAGEAQILESDIYNKFGDIDIGKENLNGLFANMTLLSIILSTLRGNVVEARSEFDDEYDYIIIGGGTAGSIMASRLSQHPCLKVLLLEAGGEQPILTYVPGFSRAFLGTSIDWSYFTAPQKYSSFGQKENRVLWNSGKVLGGGSTINSMLYVRGNKENYNRWSREGAEGWSYDEVLPYFLKLEDNGNIEEGNAGYRRRGGPMGAEKSRYYSPLRIHATEALQGLGFPMEDVNGDRQFGIYDIQATIRKQERCSTSTAYLKPASTRKNLHVVTKAFVRKILINRKDGNRAFGVVFEHGNKVHIVRIRYSDSVRGGFGEVILSNGAIRSPQTLMLSGIGPKEHLEEFRIPVIADLPGVGQNLMDHVAAGMLYTINPLLKNTVAQQVTPDSMLAYAFAREGHLCSVSNVNVVAFLDGVNNTHPVYDFPQQQLYFIDYNTEDGVRTRNLRKDVEDKVFNPYLSRPMMLCCAQLLQPYSRGEILLTSIDPHEFPHINPKYYMDPRDVKNVVEGIKLCHAVANHPAMQKIQTKWADTQRYNYPGCEHLQGNEDDYFECLARSVIFAVWHPSGTCRMGHPNDTRSVVDPQLRVLGVRNLRVVSAAIMPIIPSGNINVPTMMIAEKAYDMIKEAILCPSAYTIYGSHQVHYRN